MNIKSLLFFSLMFFSSMHAMHDGPFSPLKDAQKRFFAAIEDDAKDEQKKIAALKEILEENPDNKTAILNYVCTVNDKKQTAFSIVVEKDLEPTTEWFPSFKKHLAVLQYLVQQPEFDINVTMLTKSWIVNQGEITRNITPLVRIIEDLNTTSATKKDKQKELFKIANEILDIHKDTINNQQLFDAYQELLAYHINGNLLMQNRNDLLNKIFNHKKFIDVNHINNKGFTPLAIAILNDMSSEVIQALIDKGADLKKKYYPSDSYKFFTTPYSILDIAINYNKYNIADILHDAGARSINSKTYEKLKDLKYLKTEENNNDSQNPPLVVNSWSSARTSGLGAIGALTFLYDFCRFKKPEKITDDKKDIKRKSKDKKERSRWERIKKHTRNYKKDLLKNPRNHKKLMIPVACLLFRLLKDPIQYRNTRFA